MSDLRKAAVQALASLESVGMPNQNARESMEALRQALAQPEQDPVDLARVGEVGVWGYEREWVGLTDEDLKPLCDEWKIIFGGYVNDFAKAIEAKLKEKNA